MGWQQFVGSLSHYVFSAEESYFCRALLQKRSCNNFIACKHNVAMKYSCVDVNIGNNVVQISSATTTLLKHRVQQQRGWDIVCHNNVVQMSCATTTLLRYHRQQQRCWATTTLLRYHQQQQRCWNIVGNNNIVEISSATTPIAQKPLSRQFSTFTPLLSLIRDFFLWFVTFTLNSTIICVFCLYQLSTMAQCMWKYEHSACVSMNTVHVLVWAQCMCQYEHSACVNMNTVHVSVWTQCMC